jgi:hypothetical protein
MTLSENERELLFDMLAPLKKDILNESIPKNKVKKRNEMIDHLIKSHFSKFKNLPK